MKIIGMLPVYEEADWIEYAVRGVLDFVDRLIITEGYTGPPWHYGGNRSKDGTLELLACFRNHPKVTMLNSAWHVKYNMGKGLNHNRVLRMIGDSHTEDTWYFIVDSDEFYTPAQQANIRQILSTTDKDYFAVHDRMFVFNFKYFIPAMHFRFIRITPGMYFHHVQNPCYADGSRYSSHTDKSGELLKSDPMFHYSFVRKTEREIKKRRMEYRAARRDESIFEWINKVYLQWSIETADQIYAKNRQISGNTGFTFDHIPAPIEFYNGNHPDILDEHPYRYVDDLRDMDSKTYMPVHGTWPERIEHRMWKMLRTFIS